MSSTPNDSKYEYLFKLELRGKPIPESNQDKIAVLLKRRKKVSYLIVANFVFVMLFYISNYMGVSHLNAGWLIGIAVFFFINVALQYRQSVSIREAINFYST